MKTFRKNTDGLKIPFKIDLERYIMPRTNMLDTIIHPNDLKYELSSICAHFGNSIDIGHYNGKFILIILLNIYH